jgi:3-isopropylmalate/(R)-2-methylmalate dehydratase small subunit
MAVERLTRISGTALPLRGDNIDTDRIIPARFLRSVSFEGLEQHLFEDDRAQAASHPFANPAYDGAAILVVNANFGCGSSREHAPQAIRRRGIRAVVGESFSEIFFGNSVALGMPCASVAPEHARALQEAAISDPAATLTLDLTAMRVVVADMAIPVQLPNAARESFLDGSWDATGLLLERYDDVRVVAGRLPYISGWSDGVRAGVIFYSTTGPHPHPRPHKLQERRRRVGQFAGPAKHETHDTRGFQLRDLHRHEVPSLDLGQRAPARQHGNAHTHLHRPLDAVQARERDLDVDRLVLALVQPEDAFTRRGGIVVRDDDLPAHLADRDALPRRERMLRVGEHHQFVAAERDRLEAALRRRERHDAEVHRAVEQLGGDPP